MKTTTNRPSAAKPRARVTRKERAKKRLLAALKEYGKLWPAPPEPKTPPKIEPRRMWAQPSSFGLGCNMFLTPESCGMPGDIPVLVIPLDPASLSALRAKMVKHIRREALVTATEADDAARAALAAIHPKLTPAVRRTPSATGEMTSPLDPPKCYQDLESRLAAMRERAEKAEAAFTDEQKRRREHSETIRLLHREIAERESRLSATERKRLAAVEALSEIWQNCTSLYAALEIAQQALAAQQDAGGTQS